MRKLFLSFTGTIRGLSEGKVTQQDLDAGIFYFGCAKSHACAPWKPDHGHVSNELEWFYKDADARAVAHRRLIEAFTKAETDGRLAWRPDGGPNSYGQLNELLAANAIATIDRIDGPDSYCYPEVAEAIEEAGIPLSVVR